MMKQYLIKSKNQIITNPHQKSKKNLIAKQHQMTSNNQIINTPQQKNQEPQNIKHHQAKSKTKATNDLRQPNKTHKINSKNQIITNTPQKVRCTSLWNNT